MLVLGVLSLWLAMMECREAESLDEPCPADLWGSNRKVDIQDVNSFINPVRYFNTNVGTHPGDGAWDLVPGPGVFQYDINIQDLIYVSNRQGYCDTQVRFLSKLTDADAEFRANPVAFAAMMNQNYEAVMTFDCGICRDFGNAFNGTSFVYQDPTKILTSCEGEQPGTDCADILLTTTGQRCWQRFFNGSRYIADITQADVRDEIVAKAQALVAESAFDAIYIDVAEAYLPNAADCPALPAVTNTQWLSAWGLLSDRLQAEVAGGLILNSQWEPAWHNLPALSLVDANRFWSAPDAIEIEFGWVFGRHGEQTVSGAADKLSYLDHLHGLGTAVFDQDYDNGNNDMTPGQEAYGLAMYLIARDAADFYGTFSHDGHGSAFTWTQDYGQPIGPRQSCGGGCYQRQYEGGLIQATITTKTGTLP